MSAFIIAVFHINIGDQKLSSLQIYVKLDISCHICIALPVDYFQLGWFIKQILGLSPILYFQITFHIMYHIISSYLWLIQCSSASFALIPWNQVLCCLFIPCRMNVCLILHWCSIIYFGPSRMLLVDFLVLPIYLHPLTPLSPDP